MNKTLYLKTIGCLLFGKSMLFYLYGIIILTSVFNFNNAQAQVPISLQSAIDSATKNNPLLKNEKLKSNYLKTLINSGNNLPLTNIGMEYGQINSSYYDTKFGLGQSINFPTVYSNQKSVLKSEWKNGLLQVEVKSALLRKQISEIYYLLYYLQEKEKLLLKNDSFYSEFLKNSELKFKAGEINVMEKITAETQQGQIKVQLNQLKQDQIIVQTQFQYLLNTSTIFYPSETKFRMNYTFNFDSSILAAHPEIKLLEQQRIITSNNTALEKSKLLPDLTLNYSNMSMQGVGADNKTYNSSSRFQSAQFGVGIPLFFGAQKSKINASILNEQIASNNYTIGLNSFKNDYLKAFYEFQKYSQTVDYYEAISIKNANSISETVHSQFKNGAINYIEFVLLTNQAIKIQNDYLDAVRNLNESIIQLTYIFSN